MHLTEGRGDIRKSVPLADLRGQKVRDLAHDGGPPWSALDRGVQPPAHLSRLQPFGEAVDRDEPTGVDRLGVGALEGRLAELQRASVPFHVARKTDALALAMRLFHKGAAEPRGAHVRRRSVLLEELRLRQELPARGPPLGHASDHRDRGLLLARDERVEWPVLREIVVPRRQVPEQVANRPDLEPLEELLRLKPDARQASHVEVERAGGPGVASGRRGH